MRVFLSYSSADRPIAERIHIALETAGYEVFFDRDSLPAGESFDVRILEALAQSDLLIFLLSPMSIKAGAYSLTELGFARRQWANPAGRVLPVVIRQIDLHALPVYLRSVTLLEPEGDVAAEVVAAVHELKRRGWRRAKWVVVALAVLASVAVIGYYITQIREYNCRVVATNARALANQIIEYANTAAQGERVILENLNSLAWDKLHASQELIFLDPSQRFYREDQLNLRNFSQKRALERQLSSAVRENNSHMSKLAKEANQHRAAIFARCLGGSDASSSESDLSFDVGEEELLRYKPLDKRFKDFLKLAEQLEELAARAAKAGGEPSKKSDTTSSSP